MIKKYKTSTNLVFKVRDLLSKNGIESRIEIDSGQPYIFTEASSNTFHRCVVRALCQKISADTEFPHISNIEMEDQVYFQQIRKDEKSDFFAVVSAESRNKPVFEKSNDDFIDEISAQAMSKAKDEDATYLSIGIPDDELREKAKTFQMNKSHPEIISVFDTTKIQAQRLTALTLHTNVEQVATWLKNSDEGEQMILFRDTRVDLGHGYTNGMHLSKRLPLTGIAIVIEIDSPGSFRIVSSYPCLAGNDIKAFRDDMKSWEAYYKKKRA